jgi:hypothetical protein
MKKMVCTAAAAMLVTAAATAFAQSAKPMAPKPMTKSANADKLMANENKLLDAVRAKDAKTFSSLVMSGSWSIDETGLQSNDEFVKMMSDPKSDLKIEMLKASDMKVIDIDANTAIVTYKVDQKGSMMGTAFPPTVWASTTWANKGGTWRAVFHQESKAAPATK